MDKDGRLRVNLFRWMFGAERAKGQQTVDDAYQSLASAIVRTSDDFLAQYDMAELDRLVNQGTSQQGKKVTGEDYSRVPSHIEGKIQQDENLLLRLGYNPWKIEAGHSDKLLSKARL